MVRKVVLAAFVFAFVLPTTVRAEVISETRSVHLPRLGSGSVLVTQDGWLRGSVGFGGKFSAVQRACFNVVMDGDLLDPGEVFTFQGELWGFGRGVWPWNPPLSAFTLCTRSEDLGNWLDGREKFAVNVGREGGGGSARVVEMTVDIVGTR